MRGGVSLTEQQHIVLVKQGDKAYFAVSDLFWTISLKTLRQTVRRRLSSTYWFFLNID